MKKIPRKLIFSDISSFAKVIGIFLEEYISIPSIYEKMHGANLNSVTPYKRRMFKERFYDGLFEALSLKMDGGQYISVDLNNVQRILMEKSNAYDLVVYYLMLLCSRDYKITINNKQGVIGKMPIRYFIGELGLSKKQILRYNKILSDLKLIYIRHGNAWKHTNIYGAYEDKEEIDKYFFTYSSADTSEQSNKSRSLMAKYYHAKNGVKYSPEEIAEINRYIDKRNQNSAEDMHFLKNQILDKFNS